MAEGFFDLGKFGQEFKDLAGEDGEVTEVGSSPRRDGDDCEHQGASKPRGRRDTIPNAGLGNKLGGTLVRNALGGAGAVITSEQVLTARTVSTASGPRGDAKAAQTPRQRDTAAQVRFGHSGAEAPPDERALTGSTSALKDGPEPKGMFLSLLLNDMGPAPPEEILIVRGHRWYFKGAEELANQGKSFCYFVRCLLDLQRNVQIEEDGDVLEPRLQRACKTFVSAQCREGSMGDMYQLLTHFLSNSVVFSEWDKFLTSTFGQPRANQEAFLVPHLEQVWIRFCKFRAVLEYIFDVLNARFVWHHRLPKVGDLVRDHMRRRCFSSETITRNDMFAQEKSSSETIKKIKYNFGFA